MRLPAGHLAAALVLLRCATAALPAEAAGDVTSPPDQQAAAAAAYTVLETHCAGCHESGRLGPSPAATGFVNILALEEIARDPSLVRPGLPDASPLYTSVLRRAMPPPSSSTGSETEPGPTPEEAAALRTWIEGLAPRPSCDSAGRGAAAGDRLKRLGAALPAGAASRTRLLSLPLACADAAETARYRRGLGELVRRLARSASAGAEPTTTIEDGLLIGVDLEEIGWTAEDWDRLARLYPGGGADARREPLRADWLADALLNDPEAIAGRALSGAGSEGGEALPGGGAALAALARHWRRDVGFEQAAAELGLAPPQLAAELARLAGPARSAARRLEQGVLPRHELIALAGALRGALPPVADAAPAAPAGGPLTLSLWTDQDAYAPGEGIVIYARASADCHLTLISVEEGGAATVLFPNDLERGNLIAGMSERPVPGPGAAYRLRAGAGRQETIVGICTMPHALAEGVRPDYDRQRFTSLGDWRAFIGDVLSGRAAAREAEMAPRRRGRWGRRLRPSPPPKPEPLAPDQHARTAIRLLVR